MVIDDAVSKVKEANKELKDDKDDDALKALKNKRE
jgi:hypothetical protein